MKKAAKIGPCSSGYRGVRSLRVPYSPVKTLASGKDTVYATSVQRPTLGGGTRVGHKPRVGPKLLHCWHPWWCRDIGARLYPR